jgi:glycosyl transferase family 2
VPRAFSVVAIVAAYNEEDVVEHVVRDLIEQGVQVYFLDDGSTDRTVAIVEPYVGRGVLAIERFGDSDQSGAGVFDWTAILRRKAQLAVELDADWFIHHDADEFRESPWDHLSLKEAIEHVDALGYNAIDFLGLDFWPTDNGFRAGNDVRLTLTGYSDQAPYDRVQIRCWKKAADVDLASTGGHEARFAGRHVFPIQFVLRHYPIRSEEHGRRKVFAERRARFTESERARGWHRQYDEALAGGSFLRDPSTLTPYRPEAIRLRVAMHPHHPQGPPDLCAARSEIVRLQSEVLRGEQQIAALRDSVAQHAAELASARARIDERIADIAALVEELDRRATTLDARAEAIAALRDELQRRSVEVENWRASVDGLNRQLAELHDSLSWRMTAPARAIARVLRG